MKKHFGCWTLQQGTSGMIRGDVNRYLGVRSLPFILPSWKSMCRLISEKETNSLEQKGHLYTVRPSVSVVGLHIASRLIGDCTIPSLKWKSSLHKELLELKTNDFGIHKTINKPTKEFILSMFTNSWMCIKMIQK